MFYITFCKGAAMYSGECDRAGRVSRSIVGSSADLLQVLYFVSLYFTMVMQYTPSDAGSSCLLHARNSRWYILSSRLLIGSCTTEHRQLTGPSRRLPPMLMCNVYPRRRFSLILLGSIVEAVGVGILAWALFAEHTPTIFGMMALTGAGTGQVQARVRGPLAPFYNRNARWGYCFHLASVLCT